MAKYITKENLPVFKYVNPVSADFYEEAKKDLDELVTYSNALKESLNLEEKKLFPKREQKPMVKLIQKCRMYYPQIFFADGPGQQGILSKIEQHIGSIEVDKNTQFVGEDIRIVLSWCIRMLNLMTFTSVLQGVEFDHDDERVYYPKLFLITGPFFKEQLSSPVMDFDDLFRLLPLDTSFETFVQGNVRESKQGFHIRKVTTDEIGVSVWDRTCGCYAFTLIRKQESSYLLAPAVSCGQKKDLRRCPKWKGNKKNCVEKYEDCPERRIQAVHAVLLCLQKYLVRKKRQQVTEGKKRKKEPEKERVKDFQLEDMIAVFDYGENVLRKTSKFSGDGNSGVQKRPHIRTGHDRHLKSGKVVHVKGCVIHKEEYKGYLSADRIKA